MATARRRITYADERLDALLSITGRMDGFLYRCRNDAAYTMLYMSDGVLTLTGYPPRDFLHNQIRDFSSIIHPEDLPEVYKAVDEAIEQKRNWNVDYRVVASSGTPVWVREIGGGVFNDAGVLTFLEGFIIDISDRKDVEDVNIRLLAELKEANEELSAQKRELELAKLQSDHSANHDALTGLPNRRAFQQRLSAAIELSARSTTAVGLLLIDLDRFKDVNDTFGHEGGDALLLQVAERLRGLLRRDDFVARIGGDEFAFLLFARPGEIADQSLLIGHRVLEKLRIDVPCASGVIPVGCTVGIATAPEDAETAEGLMAMADRLMYVGKKGGRCRVVTMDEIREEPIPESFTVVNPQPQIGR